MGNQRARRGGWPVVEISGITRVQRSKPTNELQGQEAVLPDLYTRTLIAPHLLQQTPVCYAARLNHTIRSILCLVKSSKYRYRKFLRLSMN